MRENSHFIQSLNIKTMFIIKRIIKKKSYSGCIHQPTHIYLNEQICSGSVLLSMIMWHIDVRIHDIFLCSIHCVCSTKNLKKPLISKKNLNIFTNLLTFSPTLEHVLSFISTNCASSPSRFSTLLASVVIILVPTSSAWVGL